jgi:hypothetical protein
LTYQASRIINAQLMSSWRGGGPRPRGCKMINPLGRDTGRVFRAYIFRELGCKLIRHTVHFFLFKTAPMLRAVLGVAPDKLKAIPSIRAVGTWPTPKAVPVVLRLPSEVLTRVDQVVKTRRVRVPRHTWLMEAVIEKLERKTS